MARWICRHKACSFLLALLWLAAFVCCVPENSLASEQNYLLLVNWKPVADIRVPGNAFEMPSSPLSEDSIYRCAADLVSTGTAFLGFETTFSASALSQAACLQFEAAGEAHSTLLEINLITSDNQTHTHAVRLAREKWQRYEIALARVLGDSSYREACADPASSQPGLRLRLLVRNIIRGKNGFAMRNVRLRVDAHMRRVASPLETTVPLQRDAQILVRVMANGKEPFTGWLNCWTAARNEVLLPERVRCEKGWASVPVFVRTPGPHRLGFYEPESGAFSTTTLYAMPQGLRVRLEAEEFEKQQSIIAPTYLKPRATFEGGNVLPRTTFISAYDHRGQCILAQIVGAAALSAGQSRVLIPLPGLLEVRVRVYAEDFASFSSVPEVFPLLVGSTPEDAATTASVALPDGVTTHLVGGYIVAFQEPPTTATLLGEDRMALWAFARVPREVRLPLTLFGVDHPHVTAMDMIALGNLGRKLFGWQVRIGPIWARFPFDLGQILTRPGSFSWPTIRTMIDYAKEKGMRTILDVPVPPSVEVAQGLESGLDAETSFSVWLKWLGALRLATAEKQRIYGLTVPFHESFEGNEAPYPPEHLYAAYRHAYTALSTEESTPSVLATFRGVFDPAVFETHVPRAVRDWTEGQLIEPYLPIRDGSPEENELPHQIRTMRNILRKYHLLRRPLWIGPVGYSSHPIVGTEKLQANYLARLYTVAAGERAIRVFWSQLRDDAALPWEAEARDFCGLIDFNRRPKPAAIACNLALYMLTQTKAHEPISTGSLRVYPFDIELQSTRWPGKLYVAWTEGSPTTATLRLTVGKAGWYAFDYLGAQVSPREVKVLSSASAAGMANGHDRELTFEVTAEPIYVWDVTTLPPRKSSRLSHEHDCMEAH